MFTGPFRTLAGLNPPAVPARKSHRRAGIPPHGVNISSRPPGRFTPGKMAPVRWMVCLCLLVGVADAKKILIRRVRARVISVEHEDGNRIKLIGGFKERGKLPYGKPEEWTGVFLKDGHPIEGTRFRVRGMFGKVENRPSLSTRRREPG